ncbi:hypothetical protein CVT26_012207 [Gymnopilus dilepis]|uniref:Uncharacterized protein n=1 Tax=Gymnopilus dilepis TaxID=231916 RepID=A0A409YQ51_9AGAR|nr:hypothetical protein CVT26_012207 [Gymnopilus dilepis]
MRGPFEIQKIRFYKTMKLTCIQYAARFLPQAVAEGRFEDYVAAVVNLYKDRCPSDPDIDWDSFRLSLSMVSMTQNQTVEESPVHWEVGLSLTYDRAHRPSPFAVASDLGFGRMKWLEAIVEADERRLAETNKQDTSKDKVNDSWDDEGPSNIVLDFMTPGVPDMGEDAHLFVIRRPESPDIIPAH